MKSSTQCKQPVTVLRASNGVCQAQLGDRRLEAMNLDMMKEMLGSAGIGSRQVNFIGGNRAGIGTDRTPTEA